MKGHKERFIILPFSGGCLSKSSVDVGESRSSKKKPKSETTTTTTEPLKRRGKDTSCKERMNRLIRSFSQLRDALKKTSVLAMVQSLGAGYSPRRRGRPDALLNKAEVYVHKEEIEEEEREMEIGYPTDVKHLTHIGMDGKITNADAPEVISLPSISLRQFQLAMSSQSTNPPLTLNSSKY